MLSLQKGNLNACGLLYSRYKKILFTFFYNQCSNQEISEDLVHTTFEKILKYKHNYKGKGSFKSWMFAVARNAFYDEHKKLSKSIDTKVEVQEHFDRNKLAQESMGKLDEWNLLRSCLNKLSESNRELIVTAKLEGMKYRDVCEMYNLTESNLKIKIFRIIRELRQHMQVLQNENY